MSIVSELKPLLENSKTERFITDLIALVGFLLAMHAFVTRERDASNRQTEQAITEEIQRAEWELESVFKTHFDLLENKRICLATVKLRFSPNDSSKELGLLKEGQEVVMLEIARKWILISYVDQHTKRPMSGYSSKQYFSKKTKLK